MYYNWKSRKHSGFEEFETTENYLCFIDESTDEILQRPKEASLLTKIYPEFVRKFLGIFTF